MKTCCSFRRSFCERSERVSSVMVCVVAPCRTSTILTGMLAGFGFVVVGVGVAVGVPCATGPVPVVVPVAVAPGVTVALGVAVGVALDVAVAVGLAVGVAAAVGGPIAGFEVSGSLLSAFSISLILGLTPEANPVTTTTVTVFPFRTSGWKTVESLLLVGYAFFKSFWITSCTFVSIFVFKRIQMVWLAATDGSFPV